jgi:hypothetical protein
VLELSGMVEISREGAPSFMRCGAPSFMVSIPRMTHPLLLLVVDALVERWHIPLELS